MSFPPSAPYEGTDYGVSADGSVSGLADRTQGNVETQLKSTVGDGRWGQIDGGLFAIIAAAISAILGGFGTVIDAIFGVVNNDYVGGMASVVAPTVAVSSLANRVTILEGGVQVAEFNSNGTWTKPAGMRSHRVVCIGGAGGGRRPAGSSTGTTDGGHGGGQGGWADEVFADSDLGSTESVVIGGGGSGATSDATNGQTGSGTSFGSHLTGGGGLGGSTTLPTAGSGTLPGWNASGGYGQGGATSGTTSDGPAPGGNGYLCSGGAGGVGGDGGDGSSPPGTKRGVGSGGGGGDRLTGTAGDGGNGGFPGGGGGGGGTYATAGFAGNGGNGGNGRAWIISYPTDVRES